MRYLENALSLLRKRALDRDGVDWPVVLAHARELARDATAPADTYPAIRYVIEMLGNAHTFLLEPGVGQTHSERTVELPESQSLDDGVALLTIPAFLGDRADARRYVNAGIAAVRPKESARRWIVDLRTNTGGNMWPMITVLAPLLGEGTLGYFVAAGGKRTEWGLRKGKALLGRKSMSVKPNHTRLTHAEPPVAVLTSPSTASSGEATLIAFRGLDRARTFGRPTAGLATGNETFTLPDGARLLVTSVREADRTGRLYGNTPIEPDFPADDGEVLEAAQAWLTGRASPAGDA